MTGATAKVVPLRRPPQRVRVVTAASLFDGHDAAINIVRRILQGQGAEVVHLGHDRSVDEIVDAAIQEDAASCSRVSTSANSISSLSIAWVSVVRILLASR